MKPYEHRGSRRGGITSATRSQNRTHWLTPDQMAAAFEQALEWRNAWRAEVARRALPKQEPPTPPRREPEGKLQAQFAAAITRAEFGRFYWKAKTPKQAGKSKRRNGAR